MTDIAARVIPNEPDLEQPPPHSYELGAPTTNGTKRHTTDTRQALPHDLDAERNLLGAALLGAPGALDNVPDAAFYAPGHGHIAAAIRHLTNQGAYLDPVTVADQLRTVGQLDAAGGTPALGTLMAGTPATSAAPQYAEIVNRHHRARQLIHVAAELATVVHQHGPDGAHTLLAPLLDLQAPANDIDWEDVGAVIRGDYEPMRPTVLERSDGQALIYPGLLHWLMGEPGKGKTWVALHIVAEQLLAGHHVLYLDWEGNRQIIGERLAALGVTPEHIDHLHYLRPPALTRPLMAAIAALAADTSATITIYDGVAKALARNDLNEDKAPDVLAWLELAVTPITNTGCAALCLDHVVKDKDTRGSWARGSGAKIGEVSGASWMVVPKTPFSRSSAGELELKQTKDREGHVGTDGSIVARIRIDPRDDGAQVHITIDPPTSTAPEGFRPTGYMQRLSVALQGLERDGIDATVNKLLQLVPGKKEHKRTALECLITEGHVERSAGPNRAMRLTLNRPYFELDDPNSDSYRTADDAPPEPTTWEDF